MKYIRPENEIKKDSKAIRIIIGIGIPFLAISFVLFMLVYNPTKIISGYGIGSIIIFCPFNKLTGLYCPGCGMTRAAYELIHFNLLAAIRDNAMIVLVLGPIAAYYLFREYVHYVFNRKILPFPKIPNWAIICIITMLVLFTVLRNIPVSPFYYLAPIPPASA